MPATNAVSEWLFSALRRINSYLRSTMTQAPRHPRLSCLCSYQCSFTPIIAIPLSFTTFIFALMPMMFFPIPDQKNTSLIAFNHMQMAGGIFSSDSFHKLTGTITILSPLRMIPWASISSFRNISNPLALGEFLIFFLANYVLWCLVVLS